MDSPQVVDGKKVWLRAELLTEHWLETPYMMFLMQGRHTLRDRIMTHWALVDRWEFDGDPQDMAAWAKLHLAKQTLPILNVLQVHFSDLMEAMMAQEEGEAEKNSGRPSTGRPTSKAKRQRGSRKKGSAKPSPSSSD